MRILLVADGRSPTTLRWLTGLLASGHTVRLVSTFPCEPPPGIEGIRIIPVAFSRWGGSSNTTQANLNGRLAAVTRPVIVRARSLFLAGRYLLGPLTVYTSASAFRQAANSFKPDLIHALRIPFEGMLASFGPPKIPLVVSIWGNDLTLHGRGSPWMHALTVRALRKASGLIADAHRDLRLGSSWGFRPNIPTLAVPGSGGIDLDEIARSKASPHDSFAELLPAGVPLVVNPRGFRPGSVRNDTFFQAIPLVLKQLPQAIFLCPGMAGQAEALRWVERLGIASNVRLMPALPQALLWDLFQRAEVLVSISQHDGTPNSVLEGMACGCFPIAGDIESLREWITPGANGLLVDPGDSSAAAQAILQALSDTDLRCRAAEVNHEIIKERAEVGKVRKQVEEFYQRVLSLS
jgi:glycosyltransferase involved in cell wall biosynthesis